MREGGIRLVIVSNALPARARKVSEMAGVPALGMSAKADALRILACGQAHENPRAGDGCGGQISFLTDIRGGNLCGAVTIFVDPARKEERNVKIF